MGESFGIVLVEAMAAGAPVVAADLDAFARVLEDGAAGVLVRRGDATALARELVDLLGSPDRRAELAAAGSRRAADYDWSTLARQILAVYETVAPPGTGQVTAGDDDPADEPAAPAPVESFLPRWLRRGPTA
jgi:phosphatidylinositol alpha-mannosyltransferase